MSVTGNPRAAQVLLVQGVIASTLQLVRCVRDGREAAAVRELMLERRRMLAELAQDETVQGLPGSTWALREAVVESDRTLEALLA
jgi:ribosomal protein S14